MARRARELGFTSSVGILHDGHGQLRPLGEREMAVYRELKTLGSRGDTRVNALFQDNLAQGRPNDWSCRAGSRYLYVDEDGLVSYCSQMRGTPGHPARARTREADMRPRVRHAQGLRALLHRQLRAARGAVRQLARAAERRGAPPCRVHRRRRATTQALAG